MANRRDTRASNVTPTNSARTVSKFCTLFAPNAGNGIAVPATDWRYGRPHPARRDRPAREIVRPADPPASHGPVRAGDLGELRLPGGRRATGRRVREAQAYGRPQPREDPRDVPPCPRKHHRGRRDARPAPRGEAARRRGDRARSRGRASGAPSPRPARSDRGEKGATPISGNRRARSGQAPPVCQESTDARTRLQRATRARPDRLWNGEWQLSTDVPLGGDGGGG